MASERRRAGPQARGRPGAAGPRAARAVGPRGTPGRAGGQAPPAGDRPDGAGRHAVPGRRARRRGRRLRDQALLGRGAGRPGAGPSALAGRGHRRRAQGRAAHGRSHDPSGRARRSGGAAVGAGADAAGDLRPPRRPGPLPRPAARPGVGHHVRDRFQRGRCLRRRVAPQARRPMDRDGPRSRVPLRRPGRSRPWPGRGGGAR